MARLLKFYVCTCNFLVLVVCTCTCVAPKLMGVVNSVTKKLTTVENAQEYES